MSNIETTTGEKTSSSGTETHEKPSGMKGYIIHKSQGIALEQLEKMADRIGEEIAYKLNKEIERGYANKAFTIALSMAIFLDCIEITMGFIKTFLLWLIGPGWLVILLLSAIEIALTVPLDVALYLFELKKGWFLKSRTRFWWWIWTLILPELPVFDLAPNNTLVLLYTWRNVKKRAAKAQKKKDALKKSTLQQLVRLSRMDVIDIIEEV